MLRKVHDHTRCAPYKTGLHLPRELSLSEPLTSQNFACFVVCDTSLLVKCQASLRTGPSASWWSCGALAAWISGQGGAMSRPEGAEDLELTDLDHDDKDPDVRRLTPEPGVQWACSVRAQLVLTRVCTC